MRLIPLGFLLFACSLLPGCVENDSDSRQVFDETGDVRSILDASTRSILGNTSTSISSISIVADCSGPGGSFETRITSALDGRMHFEQIVDSVSWKAGITKRGTWRQTENGIEPADSLTMTFLQGHELHLLAIAPETRYEQAEYIGLLDFEGQQAHAVQMRDVLGGTVLMYYAIERMLPIGMKNVNHTGRSERDITVLFEDWEAVESVPLFKKAIFRQGGDEYVYDYRLIELNTDADSLLNVFF